MRYLHLGSVVAVLSASAMLVDGSRLGAGAAQPRPNPIVVAQTVEAKKAEADRLYQQGINQTGRGDFEEAIKSWQQALAIYRQIQDRVEEVNILDSLGTASMTLREYSEATDYFQQELIVAKKIKDPSMEQRARYWLESVSSILNSNSYQLAEADKLLFYQGDEQYRNGRFGAALRSWQEALALYRKVGNPYREISALVKVADVYRALGNYAKAVEYSEQSLIMIEKHADDSLMTLLINGQIPKSSNTIKGNVLISLGDSYFVLGNYAKAIKYYQQSLFIANKLQSPLNTWTVLNKLGRVYYAIGDYAKAIDYQQQSLAAWRTIYDSIREQGRGQALGDLGRVYYAMGDYAKAIDYQQQSLAIARDIKDRDGERNALSNLGLILATQQPELAIIFYKQAVNVIETIRGDLRPLTRDLQTSYTQSVAGTYRRLADLLLAQGRVLEAQQVLELLKIQELRDFSRDTRAGGDTQGSPLTPREAPIPPALNDKIALGQKLTACESQTPRCPERESLQNQLKTANTTFNQLADRLRTQQSTKDPAQLQRDELTLAAQKVVLAQPKTVLIYPLVLEDKLWLVWGSQAGAQGVVFESKEIPVSRKELSATVLRFRQLLTAPGDVQEFQQVSQKLYGWLIAPIRPQLDANGIQNLVFSLDRATRYIPMAALHDGQHYLVEKFAISTILTAGTTDTSEKLAANPTSTKVLGLGLSNAVSGLNPLPNVVDELNGIIRTQPTDTGIFPGSKFLNQAFDRRAFKDLIDYRILHIATHGKFVPGQPEDSFLVLGNGDPLRIPEIKSMTDLSAIHLVVLSACETAKGGEDKEGLEVSGLSYYFITSGAKAVIASLWLVNDASTSLLMQRFYQNLPKGMSKTEALRQAQLSLLHQKAATPTKTKDDRSVVQPNTPNQQTRNDRIPPGYSHPYYWAPFIVIGNGL